MTENQKKWRRQKAERDRRRAKESPAAKLDLPLPRAAGEHPYDRAVRLRLFARHEMPDDWPL